MSVFYIKVGCRTIGDEVSQFIDESVSHSTFSNKIKILDGIIAEYVLSMSTVWTALQNNIVEDNDDILDIYFPSEDIADDVLHTDEPLTIDGLKRIYEHLLSRRSDLEREKDLVKASCKKSFHNMKRLSYQIQDKSCSRDFEKAYTYYLSVSK